MPPSHRAGPGTLALVGGALVVLVVGAVVALFSARALAPSGATGARSTPVLLRSIRDLARFETTELELEKVIDLSDRQSRFFGLIEAKDAMLLVAGGEVTIGVDLGKLGDGDVALDAATATATLTLPQPEIFSVRLDEGRTYVYTRSTDLLARRNEQLESRARAEAIAALDKAAREANVTDRARQQAERQLGALVTALGVEHVRFVWR